MLVPFERLWHRLKRFGHDGPWQEPKWRLDNPMTLSPSDVRMAKTQLLRAEEWIADIIGCSIFLVSNGDLVGAQEAASTAGEIDDVIDLLLAAQSSLTKGIDPLPMKGYTGL